MHAEHTVKRAKRRLAVQSSREGFGPGSKVLWFLPDRPPYDDASIEGQPPTAPQPVTVGAVWQNPRNGADYGHVIAGQRSIPGQPQRDGPVCDVGAVCDVPDPIVETAKGLAALAPDELAAYRLELAVAPATDPHVYLDRKALALFDAMARTGATL
jgi:hypothetical protein